MNNVNWTRKQLKDRAKISFKQNYWKCVLAAVLFAIFTSLIGGMSSGAQLIFRNQYVPGGDTTIDRSIDDIVSDFDEDFDDNDIDIDDQDDDVLDIDADIEDIIGEEITDDDNFGASDYALMGAIGLVLGIMVLVVFIFSSLIQFFLGNPIMVGVSAFFYKNDKENAGLDNLGRGFKGNYLNVVKVLFFRDLKIFGWTLLLIIPGIIKEYEYRMLPYILADNPDLSSKEAFAKSREMMNGQKWKAFVLDLSFILWLLLSGLTLGLVGVFYVNPYMAQTNANLYALLKGDYEGIDLVAEPAPKPESEEQPIIVEFED